MTNQDNNLISVQEAADILGYSRMHVFRLIKSNKIVAEQVGRSYVINKNSLGGIFKKITPSEEKVVGRAMNRVLKDFEPVLKKLSKE